METKIIKTLILGAGIGAASLAILGFGWGGWVTGSKADVMVANAAQDAVMNRLAPICVANFKHDPQMDEKLVAFKKIQTWNRGDFVDEQGWATMLGEENADRRVSRKCAELISEING